MRLSSNYIQIARLVLFGAGALFILVFIAFWVMFLDLRRVERLLLTQDAELLSELTAFENQAGYGGFIHDFKNAVLQPEDPQHLAAARQDIQSARETLERIAVLAASAELSIDFSPVRETLDTYDEISSRLERGSAADLSPSDLDRLVRTSDDFATNTMDALSASASAAFGARTTEMDRRVLQISALTAIFNGLLVVTAISAFVILRRQEAAALQAIKRANERLEMVLETSTSGVVALGADRNVLLANGIARSMFGLGHASAPFLWPKDLGFLNAESLSPLDSDADPVATTFRGGTARGEVVARRLGVGGEMRYLRVSTQHAGPARYETESDLPIRIVMVFEDVTDQEVGRQKFERAGRLDALGQLTGGIAHDFNNILASIMYALELSLNTPLPEKVRDWLERAKSSVSRGSDLSRRLLTFAKKQPGAAVSRPVSETLHDIRGLLHATIKEPIEISLDEPDDALWVYCDQGQLESALVNLVLNSRDAIHASGHGSSIRIAVRGVDRPMIADTRKIAEDDTRSAPLDVPPRQTRFVEISVTDDGPGMSSEVRRRAIDPFFTTKGANSGSGLGLSIVYGFVQQSGGEMRIYSEPKLGTTVRLLIPRGTPQGAADQTEARLPMPMGQSERLFVVEDDASLQAMIKDMVTSLGYRFLSAKSGDEALELIDDGIEFDLLLTDIMMPGKTDGYGLARELRARRPSVPVVYMSGYAGLETKNSGNQEATWIQKPCTAAELARTLRFALNRA
ncbi:MAG: ATP-binding protein [Pseudomonadota bacterium]